MKAKVDMIAKALGVKRVRDERVDMGKVARVLGTKSAGKVTAKGGYFGAMQLAEEVRTRLQKPAGGGRSTDPEWTERRLLPLKPATLDRLARIAGSHRGKERRGGAPAADRGDSPGAGHQDSDRRRGRQACIGS